jgi:hypothetical protein
MPRRKNIPAGDPYWKAKWQDQKASGEAEDDKVRQKARRAYDKAGIDRTGKQIDHKKPLRSGGTNAKGNLRLRDPSANMAAGGRDKATKKG